MKDMCVYCKLCCKLIPVDISSGIVVRNGIENLTEDLEDLLIPISRKEAHNINENYVKNILKIFPNIEFFTCKHATEQKICECCKTIEICNKFPDNAFAFVDEDCPYQGKIFLFLEEIKQKIRKLKEEILDYEAIISATKDKKEKEHYRKMIIFHQKQIGKYKRYGSNNW